MKALSEARFCSRNSTQHDSRDGTAYFLAVYNVDMTVSGSMWTLSEYKNLKPEENIGIRMVPSFYQVIRIERYKNVS